VRSARQGISKTYACFFA